MATLTVERFGPPSTARGARWLEAASRRADAALAERTVWCATASRRGRARAGALRSALDRVRALDVAGEDELSPVGRADVVVAHDPIAAGLAEAIRERGAHVIVDAEGAAARSPAVHAYVIAWLAPGALGVAAVIPAAGGVAAKEVERGRGDRALAWSTLLADILSADAGETVGGRFHPRPAVAAR